MINMDYLWHEIYVSEILLIVNTRLPSQFAISNSWCFPNNTIDSEVSNILEPSIAHIRIFPNVYSYNAGSHKAIKGHHIFLLNDPEHVDASFEYLIRSRVPSNIHVMICVRVTPSQGR